MLEAFWSSLLDPKDPLVHYRQKGWDIFETIGLPKPKQEAFQYLKKPLVFLKPAEKKNLEASKRQGLVFVDGFFEKELSDVEESLSVLSLEEALQTYGLFLQNRFETLLKKEKDPFAALNFAFAGKGAFIFVPPKTKCHLNLYHLYSSHEEMAHLKLHIYLSPFSEVRLEKRSEGKKGFSNEMIDVLLDKGAKMTLIDQSEKDLFSLRVSLKKDASFKSVFLGKSLRSSLGCELLEEGAEVSLLGLAHLSGVEESHIHARVDHLAPYTLSNQHFKSVLKDQARFSFEGKIYVDSKAQKIQSYQLNNNLLLSDECSANAKPNLEIFADDVKASHGATTAQISKEELFYLCSRGIAEKRAKELLVEGFCKEIEQHAL